MIMSKCVTPEGRNLMPIYEATDDSMLNWKYRGIFFENNGEVVNFFKIEDKWVLIYSPYATIEYFVGDFDIENYRFISEYHGILCYGYHSQNDPVDRGFYASYVFEEEKRKVISGWISGFSDNEYWNGCMGIPREVGLNNNRRITQKPITELSKLRERLLNKTDNTEFVGSDTMDIEAKTEKDFCLSVEDKFNIKIFDDGFSVNGERYFCEMPKDKTVRILIDRSVAEIFFGDGSVTATRCFDFIGNAPLIKTVGTKSLKCYKIKNIKIEKAL